MVLMPVVSLCIAEVSVLIEFNTVSKLVLPCELLLTIVLMPVVSLCIAVVSVLIELKTVSKLALPCELLLTISYMSLLRLLRDHSHNLYPTTDLALTVPTDMTA